MRTNDKKKTLRGIKKKTLRGIKEVKPGVFLIRVQKLDPRTGKPVDVRRKIECATLAEAAVAQMRLREEIEKDEKPRERVRLKDYAHSSMLGRLPVLKASTRHRYASDLDQHILPVLGDLYLDALSPEDVHEWFAAEAADKAPATVNGYLRVLKTLMADAVVQYRLPLNPTGRIRAVPERRRDELESDEPVNMLSEEEMGTFLALVRERWPQWYAMVFTQFATARRFGEVSALRWEDIDEEHGVIKIRRAQWRGIVDTPKTGKVVRVPLLPELKDVLREWRQYMVRTQHRHLNSGWIFPSQAGKPHTNASVMRKAFIDCLKQMDVGRRFSSHGLRRTANDLLRRVSTGEVTRAITGHMTQAMTEHYSHVDVGEKTVAVERMLKLIEGGKQRGEAIAKDDRGGGSTPSGERKTGIDRKHKAKAPGGRLGA